MGNSFFNFIKIFDITSFYILTVRFLFSLDRNQAGIKTKACPTKNEKLKIGCRVSPWLKAYSTTKNTC